MPGSPRVLFLLPYPLNQAPSQRFRVEMLLPLLQEKNIRYTLRPFMDAKTWAVLYQGGSVLRKIMGIARGFVLRLFTVLFEAPAFDQIFIHREAAPLGPPVFEWYLARVLGKKIIYDFDDAIWIANTSAENRLANWLKFTSKIGKICQWSHGVSAGNTYLGRYASESGAARVVFMPTVVDTSRRYAAQKKHEAGRPVVGWTGSHSTLKYLDMIMPLLKELQQELDFSFLVIADKKPFLDLDDWTFIPWNEGHEIDDLLKIDVGIMPLPEDQWAEGKCGFKLIQYMALGIPAIASAVGVNKEIISEGVNGYLCSSTDEWRAGLRELISDAALRKTMGERGREKIVSEYSIEANREKFLELFEGESGAKSLESGLDEGLEK